MRHRFRSADGDGPSPNAPPSRLWLPHAAVCGRDVFSAAAHHRGQRYKYARARATQRRTALRARATRGRMAWLSGDAAHTRCVRALHAAAARAIDRCGPRERTLPRHRLPDDVQRCAACGFRTRDGLPRAIGHRCVRRAYRAIRTHRAQDPEFSCVRCPQP